MAHPVISQFNSPAVRDRFRTPTHAGYWFALVGLAIPFLITLVALTTCSENVVFHDDYTLLRFLLRWTDPALAWSQKLTLLIDPHNFHRIVYDRLITLATYYLTGRMNVLLMIALGNLALLGIIWRLWSLFRMQRLPIWYFLPIPYFLLNLQSHENMFWGMAGLQNFTVIWFMFEALHRLIRRDSVGMPLLLSVLALFTSGNGILVLGIGSGLIVWQGRQRTDGWIWFVGILGALALFFFRYERAPLQGELSQILPRATRLLGASLTNDFQPQVALLVGIIVMVGGGILLLMVLFNQAPRLTSARQPAAVVELLAFMLIVLATALILGLSRSLSDLGRDRYRIYSHLSFGLVYLLGLMALTNRWRPALGMAATVLALMMYASALYAKLPEVLTGQQNRQLDAFNFRFNQTTLAPPYFAAYNDSLLLAAQQRNVYQFPVLLAPPTDWKPIVSTPQMAIAAYQLDNPMSYFAQHNQYFRITSRPATLPDHTGINEYVWLIAESANKQRFALPASRVSAGKKNLLTRGEYFQNELISLIQKAILPVGTYRLGLLYGHADGSFDLAMTSQTITVTTAD